MDNNTADNFVRATDIDLEGCAHEPIHIPGSIQPHGVLIAASASGLRITHVSENLQAWCGLEAHAVLGRPLSDIIGNDICNAMVKALASERYSKTNILSRILPIRADTLGSVLAHRNDDQIIVEIEPDTPNAEFESGITKAQSVVARLRNTKSLVELCNLAAQEIRALTGYDRVMVYRFDDDEHGQVIAEDRAIAQDSFLGLHYPASDIPPQARRLYLLQRIRIIPRIGYVPVKILAGAGLNDPVLDMSFCSLRSVSLVHMEYLRNMGITATLTLSIIHDQKLWGMIVCHHYQPIAISPQMRALCDLIGQLMGTLIAEVVERQSLSAQVERQHLLFSIGRNVETANSLLEGLARDAQAVLTLTGATGAFIHFDGKSHAFGQIPPGDIPRDILNIFSADKAEDIIAIDNLGAHYKQFQAAHETASGILVLPVTNSPGDGMVWFRPEIPKTVTWGGDPMNKAQIDRSTGIISPRKSFAAWRESVKGRSAPWTEADMQAAQDFRRTLTRAVLRHTEAELARVSNADPLTGLANRRVLQHHIREWELGEAKRPAALMFCDLDRFKTVNDSLGHYAGDHLLVSVAHRLSNLLADRHLLVRLGGDEFVIFCENMSQAEALSLAQDILNLFDEPFLVDGRPYRASVSVGIACATTPCENLLRDADAAMYEAKRQGANRAVLFQNTLHKKVLNTLRTEQDLFLALERQELVVHYQPIVAMPDGQITGFEALSRWLHPERGWVSPAEFIPLAEQTGLISKIGRRVIAEAISQLAALANPSLLMAINVSAHQLQFESFVQEVKEILAIHSMPAERVTLEVTESTLMEDSAVRQLVQLRDLGCRVAIDDFGTGHSSLAYLQRLPVDVIKIDRSFVTPLGKDPKAENFLRVLIALAHTLNLTVIVEGVETEAQYRILAAMPCDKAQGYFFGKPQAMNKFA